MSIEPLRDGIDDALHTWAQPARAHLPLAIFCAAEDEVTGYLCERLAGHGGDHDPDGIDTWADDTNDTEENANA
jgi:hypothetical protein